MANAWLTHLKKTHKLLPKGTSLKAAMKAAKKTYKKMTGAKANPGKKHRRSNKKRRGGAEGDDGSDGTTVEAPKV